jgi:MerR family transcriptional regulator, light-induced transcriptional regulator
MTTLDAIDPASVLAAYVSALREGDRRAAFRVIDEARTAGLALATIYMEVFQPALREIGRLWQVNAISVADEHLATAITQAAMARVYGQVFTWTRRTAHTLIAACVDSERHEVGLRMLCDLLECEGWDTTYLGATVPVESLVAMVRDRRPEVLALSAALPPHLPQLRATIEAIRSALGADAPLVLVGGRPFVEDPGLAARLGADLTASDAAAAVALLTRTLDAA